MAKKKSVGQLMKKAKPLFRLYVRHRDTNEQGWGFCITCGRRVYYKEADAGHFAHRYANTYFVETNTHLQCKGCNNGGLGEQYKYGIEIDKRYGSGTAAHLLVDSHKTKIFRREELEEMIARWEKYIAEHPKDPVDN